MSQASGRVILRWSSNHYIFLSSTETILAPWGLKPVLHIWMGGKNAGSCDAMYVDPTYRSEDGGTNLPVSKCFQSNTCVSGSMAALKWMNFIIKYEASGCVRTNLLTHLPYTESVVLGDEGMYLNRKYLLLGKLKVWIMLCWFGFSADKLPHRFFCGWRGSTAIRISSWVPFPWKRSNNANTH